MSLDGCQPNCNAVGETLIWNGVYKGGAGNFPAMKFKFGLS